MRQLLKKKFIILLFLTCIIFLVSACANANDVKEESMDDKEKLILADPQWDSAGVHNSIAQFIMEEGYGYETETMSGSSSSIVLGIREGDIDIHMEMWTDNMPDPYFEGLETGEIVKLSTNYDDNIQGLYVPAYVIEGDPEKGIEPIAPDLKTVQDLERYAEIFPDEEDAEKGRIYGVPPVWGETDIQLRTKVENYGLLEHYNYFNPGSEAALAASITAAYEGGKPWVGYYWEPTWIIGKYNLILLDDVPYDEELWNNDHGYSCQFPSMDVDVVVHQGMMEKAPDIVEFLKKYQTSSLLTSNALAYMREEDTDIDEAALWFLIEHEEVWTKWVTEDIAEKVKGSL